MKVSTIPKAFVASFSKNYLSRKIAYQVLSTQVSPLTYLVNANYWPIYKVLIRLFALFFLFWLSSATGYRLHTHTYYLFSVCLLCMYVPSCIYIYYRIYTPLYVDSFLYPLYRKYILPCVHFTVSTLYLVYTLYCVHFTLFTLHLFWHRHYPSIDDNINICMGFKPTKIITWWTVSYNALLNIVKFV